MTELYSASAESTRALGARLAARLQAGDTLMLYGDLGAGKSELARGIARGLGVTGPVGSPSFTILNVYDEGRLPLYHFDWYRLESEEELYELGMEEYLGGDGVAVVEWPDRCPGAIPEKRLDITLTPTADGARLIRLEARGGFRLPDESALKGSME